MRKTLTEARKRCGWTPEELAKHSGVSRATIYRIEANTVTNPGHNTVQKLELALRLRRGTLVFGPVPVPEAQAS